MNGLTAMGPALSAADMLVTAKSPVSTSSQPAQIPTAIAAPIGPQDSAHVGLAQVHQFSIGPVGIQDVPPATGLEVQQFLSDQASVHPSAIALSGDDLLIFTPSAPPVRASMADIRTAMTPGLAASPMGQALQVFEVAHNSGLSSAPIRAILSGHQAEPAAPPPSMAETLSHVAFAVDVEIYVNSPRGLAADMSAAARFTGQAQRGVEISAILQSSPVKMRPEIIRMHQAALDGGLQVITKAFADARQTGKYDGAFDAIQSFHKLCASITESPHWQNRSATLQTTIAEAQSKRVVPVSLGSQADPNPALGLPSADHADDAVSQPSQFTPGQTPAPGLPSADHAYDAVSQPSQFTPGQTPAPSLPSADHAYDAVSQPSQFTPGQTPAVSLPPTDHAYDTVPKPPQAAQSPTLAAASDPPPTDHAYDTVPKRPQSVPAPTPAAESVPPPTDHAYDTVPKPPQAAPAPAAVTMIADKNISAESLRFAKKNQLKRPGKVGDVVLNRQGEVFKLPDPAPSRENAENRPAGQAEAPSAHEPAKYTETADLHEALKELERDADPTQAHWDRTSAGKVAIVPDRHKAVIDGQEVEVHRKRWVAETDGAIAGANKRYGDYRQEENTEVYTVYHDDQTRQQYEVTADRLSDEDGQPGADVNGRKGTMGLDTPVSRHRGEHTFNADPERLPYTKQTFVLATTGQLYMASEHEASGKRLTANSGDLHHSSFLSGQPVAGAGELFLHADRTLAIVNNESGHYRPAAGLTRQVLQELTDRQVDLDNVRVNNRDNGAVYKGMAKEFMQGASQAGEGAWAQQRGKAPPRERTGEDMATLFRNRHAVTAQILSGAAARFFQQY